MAKKGRGKSGKDNTLSQETDMIKTLWDISQSLYQHLNIDDLILHIIKQMKEVMSAEGVSVILHDDSRDEFVFYCK